MSQLSHAPVPDVPVPEDADSLSVAGTWLGPGRQVHANHAWPEPPVPVAWVTTVARPAAGLKWAGLSRAAAHTGLQPILLRGLRGGTARPWDEEEFGAPEDPARIDEVDAETVLREGWGGLSLDDEEFAGQSAEWIAGYFAMFEPYGAEFPGLAPASTEPEDHRQLARALGPLTPDARIGLVPAARPADVLARLGWGGAANSLSTPAVCAVLRSWEDRFGARLLEVGFADIRLVVSRPPRTREAALPIAAEHQSFCDECARTGLRHVSMIARTLVGNPFWDFWWD